MVFPISSTLSSHLKADRLHSVVPEKFHGVQGSIIPCLSCIGKKQRLSTHTRNPNHITHLTTHTNKHIVFCKKLSRVHKNQS
jgi:hypothetical protein